MDYNADHYTIGELLTILGLDEYDITSDAVLLKTSEYRHEAKQKNNQLLVSFFEQVQTKLLRYLQDQDQEDQEDQIEEDQDQDQDTNEVDQEDQEEYEDQDTNEVEEEDQYKSNVDLEKDLYLPNDEQTRQWTIYETLPQPDAQQRSKITDRTQQTELYDNGHMPMKREQLGVNQTHSVPVAQDSLNPTLKNVTNRFINLDSQFRQPSGGNESLSTDFTLDLSDPLTNVLSLRLYSIQIPYTWYAIDTIYGNTCFWLTNKQISYQVTVDPGNYTPAEFCLAIQRAFLNAGFTYQPPIIDPDNPPPPLSVAEYPSICIYYANEAKIRLQLANWIDPDKQPIITTVQYESVFHSETDAYFTFYDVTGFKTCQTGSTCNNNATHKFDNTLGWLMGFRVPIQPVFTGGNKPLSVINLYGTKYFIVVLDDYNQNHINNGLITITEQSGSFALPSYYNTSQPYLCRQLMNDLVNIDAIGNLSNLTNQELIAKGINPSNVYNTVQDKWTIMPTPFEQVLPSAPRTLTNAQLYTVNELIKTKNKNTSFRSKAPTNSDTFAIIPIKYNGLSTGQLYTEVSGQFQDNKRVYFGPVNIERLRLRLLDDRGNIIDLHGADWCVTILSENLYQY